LRSMDSAIHVLPPSKLRNTPLSVAAKMVRSVWNCGETASAVTSEPGGGVNGCQASTDSAAAGGAPAQTADASSPAARTRLTTSRIRLVFIALILLCFIASGVGSPKTRANRA